MAAAAAAAVGSSAGLVLRSASAVVCKPVTGSHVLRIDGYSHLAQAVGKGDMVRSSAFAVGDHSWRLMLYPNGDSQSKLAGHIGVYLRLDSAPTGEHVWARPSFSVLDQKGDPAHVHDAGSFCFNKHLGVSWGFPDFIAKEKLVESEYLKDDRFAIQCDVTVTTVTECRDHMAFISPSAEFSST
ncbi:hypothetical protein ACP4OV_001553 [Aristida adscensionis]